MLRQRAFGFGFAGPNELRGWMCVEPPERFVVLSEAKDLAGFYR
jgi:hypothetical protein